MLSTEPGVWHRARVNERQPPPSMSVSSGNMIFELQAPNGVLEEVKAGPSGETRCGPWPPEEGALAVLAAHPHVT